MSQHCHTVDVARPVRSVYDAWTRFEEFPRFMQHVEAVTVLDDERIHWVVEYAGVEREFDAVVTERVPDERVAWTAVDGPHQAGVVTFYRLDEATTRVSLDMNFSPEGLFEHVGDMLGFVTLMVEGDLEAFKTFIETADAGTQA